MEYIQSWLAYSRSAGQQNPFVRTRHAVDRSEWKLVKEAKALQKGCSATW